MPAITSEDYRNVVLATLIPGSTGLFGGIMMIRDPKILDFWEGLPKPSWAPKSMNFYMSMDIMTLSPLGCASYLVYKYGGGFQDSETKMALCTYGFTNLSLLASVPAIHSRNMTTICTSIAATTALSALTTFLFYRINAPAGWMMMPFTLWSGCYLALGIYATSRKSGYDKE